MRVRLAMMAWLDLLYLDLVGIFGLRALQRAVSRTRLRQRQSSTPVPSVVKAMQTACMLYVKPAKCLQRSAVVTRLMRREGIDADLVIGVRLPPLEAHAWVEVEGAVVSDDMTGLKFYRVLDRW